MSLQQIVGKQTYTTWVEMLRRLVPDGRTHRLAPLIAGMLQYASTLAQEKYGDDPEEGSVAHALLMASEAYDPAEAEELLGEVLEQLFSDAKVNYQRVSSRGMITVSSKALFMSLSIGTICRGRHKLPRFKPAQTSCVLRISYGRRKTQHSTP